jgi:hypothetical protein
MQRSHGERIYTSTLREEYVARALEMIPNTCPFDVTGHPAMNVPCGMSSGLLGGPALGRWDGAARRACLRANCVANMDQRSMVSATSNAAA